MKLSGLIQGGNFKLTTNREAALIQGTFYILTGVWPVVSYGTFEAISGPKTDTWLVKTVGLLLTTVGCVELLAAVRDDVGPSERILGCGIAMVLAAVDLGYVGRGRISKVYLADALAELGLVAFWLRSPCPTPGREVKIRP